MVPAQRDRATSPLKPPSWASSKMNVTMQGNLRYQVLPYIESKERQQACIHHWRAIDRSSQELNFGEWHRAKASYSVQFQTSQNWKLRTWVCWLYLQSAVQKICSTNSSEIRTVPARLWQWCVRHGHQPSARVGKESKRMKMEKHQMMTSWWCLATTAYHGTTTGKGGNWPCSTVTLKSTSSSPPIFFTRWDFLYFVVAKPSLFLPCHIHQSFFFTMPASTKFFLVVKCRVWTKKWPHSTRQSRECSTLWKRMPR